MKNVTQKKNRIPLYGFLITLLAINSTQSVAGLTFTDFKSVSSWLGPTHRITDLSADGRVLIGNFKTAENTNMGFRYSNSTGVTPLGLLPGAKYSDARFVSPDGKVITGISFIRDYDWNAYRYTTSNGMVKSGIRFPDMSKPVGITSTGDILYNVALYMTKI